MVSFPFSDLTQAKRRPALVLAELAGDDRILCQITSQPVRDSHAIALEDRDFKTGSLKQSSNIRPNRLFTADRHIILYSVGLATVLYESEAARQLEELPAKIMPRILGVAERRDHWPAVSGAKPLKGKLVGRYRIRTGDYRVQFRVEGDTVFIEKLGHQDDFYED